MGDDLVKRLRGRQRTTNLGVSDGDVMRQAADRIESLERHLQAKEDGLRAERDGAYERAAEVAGKPMLPCDVGGDLILDQYTADTIAAAIRQLKGQQHD